MSNISAVDLQGLLQTAQGQEEALSSAKSQLQNVVTQSESLASSWTGEAAQTFQGALNSFNENGQAVLNALQAMHNAMMNTHSVFTQANSTTIDSAGQAAKFTSAAPAALSGLAGL
jgi:WXG100 family type VII secretion target